MTNPRDLMPGNDLDPTRIDEVWAEEGGVAVRIRHDLYDQRKIEIVRYVKADKAEVVAVATINFGRCSRLAKALWPERYRDRE